MYVLFNYKQKKHKHHFENFHIHTVHLDVINFFFIHQLMHR